MRSGTIFLRTGCTLPRGLGLPQKQFCETWTSVEHGISTALGGKVRDAGWHFMRLEETHSSYGFGDSEALAAKEAITRALGQVKSRSNAAELQSIKLSKYPGLWIARITLYTRQIVQPAVLGLAG